MPDVYVFGDESGELAFHPKSNRYFIVTTLTVRDCRIGDDLLALRRQLAWEGVECHPEFHAQAESQEVRDRVFEVLQRHEFRVDATIYEKRKEGPALYRTLDTFYRFAWWYHFKHVAEHDEAIRDPSTRLLVVPATLSGRKKKQELFSEAVRDVVARTTNRKEAQCAFWMAWTDPCLWAVDYCSWAIQRRWEHVWEGQPDDRSHRLIRDKIRSEFDIFRSGTRLYY